MNQNKRLKRRIILSSVMLIIICSAFSLQSTENSFNSVSLDEHAQIPTRSVFEGTGKNFTIMQHATAISSTYDVNPTTTTSFTLTNGWTAENITIEVENVTRYRNLVQNPTCDYDYGQSEYFNWEYYTTNGAQLPLNVQSNRLSLDVGYGTITPDEIAYFNQTVNIDEEEVSTEMVELSFDARMYSSPGDSGLYLFGAVIIGGVEHNYTIDTTTDTTDIYQTYTMQYYLNDEGQELPNNVEFRLGAYVNQTLVYGSDPTHNDVHFDNIEFNVYTYVNQEYALRAQDVDTLSYYNYVNTSSGQGEFTITDVQKNYISTQDVEFTISKNPSLDGTVTIENLTISSDLLRSINSSLSSFQDNVFSGSDDILWTYTATSSIPLGYVDKWIEIEKPADWEIISAVDPFLTNQTSSCEALGYGTTKFIVPSSVFSSGDWQIRARSKSWFDEAKLEFWNGASFVEKTDYFVNDDFHVKVNINNTVALANTNLNFTLYHPNGTVFHQESEEPSAFEYYFGNFTVGLNMTLGTYTAEIAWTNNLSSEYVDKVGYKTFEFNVYRRTQLTALDPIIESSPGDPILVRVLLEDSDLNEPINFADIEYNSTFGQSGTLTNLGDGYYVIPDLDTSSLDYQDYYLSFNTSKVFYQNLTADNLVEIRMREGMVMDTPSQINSVYAKEDAIFDFNLTGELSGTPLTSANTSTDWIGDYNINHLVDETYRLTINTSDILSGTFPETYIVKIFANKTNYGATSGVVLLQISPIQMDIDVNETFIEVTRGSPFSVKVNYTESLSGTHVADADCTATWSLSKVITPEVDGFTIEYATTGLDIDQYISVIEISKSDYETKSIVVTVLINPVQTVISANTSFLRVSTGSQFTVKVNYTEYYGGALIPSATCSVTWEPGIYYEVNPVGDEFEIIFNTTSLSLKQYTATIQLNKTGYETKNVFITVLVDPISTAIAANETLITIEPGKIFSITVNYTDAGTGFLISGADCIVTWNLDTNITEVVSEFNIDFDTTGLALGQYSALIQISKAGYETQNLFITVLVNPIHASIAGNITLVQIEQGKVFSIIANYTDIDTGFLISGASCIVTWGRDTNITDVANEFVIDFDTTSLALGQYTAIIQISKTGYETQSLFITVLIQPVSSDLNILIAEPVEFFLGDQATISVEYIVDGVSFGGGTVTLVGDIEGTLVWNGTVYSISFDTSDLDTKIYATQIFAQAAGVQTQIYDLYIRIQPVEYDIDISSISVIISDSGTNTITIIVYDVSHGVYVDDANLTCNIDGTFGIIDFSGVEGSGTYTLNLDQFGLSPAINPYSLHIDFTYPNGDVESFIITIVVPRDLNLLWWIAGSVGGTILLGLSSLFIYFRYVKQTRFQRDVAFIKKNIANPNKIKSRSEPDREKMVSEIINKEIDQLL